MEPIATYDSLPEGYAKVNSVYELIEVTPRLPSMYTMNQGTIIIQNGDAFVEFNIDHNLREEDITNQTFIKLL